MATPRPLLVFPCNGNGTAALDCLGDEWQCVGFVDDTPEKHGRTVLDVPVFGRTALRERGDAAVLAVLGSPLSYRERRTIIDGLGVPRERFARVIHPRAEVAAHAVVGTNCLVTAGVVLMSTVVVGDHIVILPNTVLAHDVTVGDWTLIAANVTIAGDTTIGENCYVGAGACVSNGVTIGAGALVGIGSVVIHDVPPGARVVGNPARPLGA